MQEVEWITFNFFFCILKNGKKALLTALHQTFAKKKTSEKVVCE